MQALHKEFEILHKIVGETVMSTLLRLLPLVNKIKENGDDKGDVVIVKRFWDPWLPSFDYVVCSIKESKDTSMLTINELQSSLLVHEQCMGSYVEEEYASNISHGDQSGGKVRGTVKGGCGRRRGKQFLNKAIIK